jgi:putative photosynthetic complex assembly protein 2
MTPDVWIAGAVALFAWWFSTGAILLVVKRADRGGPDSHRWAVLCSLFLLVIGVAIFVDTLGRANVSAVYAQFFAVLAIWGWIELAFLCGMITGPITKPCPSRLRPGERFLRAWGVIAYHELLLFVTCAALCFTAVGAATPYGAAIFGLLFIARVSAKLNLFLGVPRINTEFLPLALSHVPSHFRIARMNALFPVSVIGLGWITLWGAEHIMMATSRPDVIGYSLFTALAALALLEHLFMVVPLPDAKLWRWLLPASGTDR